MRNSSSSVGLRQPRWAQSWLTDADNQDEELALFNDMKTQESKSFLHLSHDEIDASFQGRSHRDGLIGSPSRTPPWRRNDLLAPDAEKNDYDWLLTPPGTPLFPSLDKEPTLEQVEQICLTPTHYTVRTSRLSRTNTRETQNRTSRRSPGPHTPTATSSISSSMRGKTPSPSRTTSSPTPRSATPTKASRSTSTINRASMRSSPPILQRLNTSPSVRSPSTERSFPTPKQRTRGASLSPKPHAWQSTELGFSEEPPPNLRTCIPDRTLSNSRGSMLSLRSRHSLSDMHGHHSSSSGSRVSSTTASQDYWSSKGSVMSSSDDGTDIMEPTFIDFSIISPRSTLEGTKPASERKFDNEVTGSRHHPHTTQRRRSISSSETSGFFHTAGRKSLEPSIRRVDHHHASQNMFRPLLSSAPTNFYTEHHRESPIAASSNASSEKGVRIFPGNESSDEEDSVISRITSNEANKLMHTHGDKFEVESVTDSIPGTIGTVPVSEMEKTILGKFHESEHVKLATTNQNHQEMPAIEEDKSFPIKSPIINQKHDDTTELGLITDAVASDEHHYGIADKLFIDLKEDNSMTDNPCKKYQTNSSHDSDHLGLHVLATRYNQDMVPVSTQSPTTKIPGTCFSEEENVKPTILNDTQQKQVTGHEENDRHENELVGSINTPQSNHSTCRKDLDDCLQTKKMDIRTTISSEDTSKSYMIQEHDVTEISREIVRHAYMRSTDSSISNPALNDVETWDGASSLPPKSPRNTGILHRSESDLQHEDGLVEHMEEAIQLNYGLNPENFPLETDMTNNGIQHQQLLKEDTYNADNLCKKSFDGKDPSILMNENNYHETTILQFTDCLEETARMDIGTNIQTNTSSSKQIEPLESAVMDTARAIEDVASRPDTTETTEIKDLQDDILQRPVNPMEILDVLDDTYTSHHSNEPTHLPTDVHPNPDIAETTEVTALKDVHPIPGTINVIPEEATIFTGDHKNKEIVCTQMATLEGEQQMPTTDLAVTANLNWKAPAYNFSLEETTNKILFCSSIIHDIVYEAANIAAEKESRSTAMTDPVFHKEKKQIRYSDYRSSLREKISKPGTWRGRQKENKSPSKTLQRDEVDSVPDAVIQHPVTINEMKRDEEKVDAARTSPQNSKEKNHVRFAANTNCRCNIM